ncbi:MAG: DUF4365 domain-containing protein [Candidatus Hodarchaeales archaeon]|jgi:hypothetical protein
MRSNKNKQEDTSRARLKFLLNEWIINDLTNDFGFDLEVRIAQTIKSGDQVVKDQSFYIQIRSSNTSKRAQFEDIKIGHLILWNEQTIPVVLMKYDVKQDLFYWDIVQEYVSDIIAKKNSKWKHKAFTRLRFRHKLENLDILKKQIFSCQKRVIKTKAKGISLLDAIKFSPDDLTELRSHKEKAQLEYWRASLIESMELFKGGDREISMRIWDEIYSSADDNRVKILIALGSAFADNYNLEILHKALEVAENNSLQSEYDLLSVIINGIYLLEILDEKLAIIAVNRALKATGIDLNSLGMDLNSLGITNSSNVEYFEETKSDVYDLISELYKANKIYYIIAASFILSVITKEIRVTALSLNKAHRKEFLQELNSNVDQLAEHCEQLLQNIGSDYHSQFFSALLLNNLADYYYWTQKKSKALKYKNAYLLLAQQYNHYDILQETNNEIKTIKKTTDPYLEVESEINKVIENFKPDF